MIFLSFKDHVNLVADKSKTLQCAAENDYRGCTKLCKHSIEFKLAIRHHTTQDVTSLPRLSIDRPVIRNKFYFFWLRHFLNEVAIDPGGKTWVVHEEIFRIEFENFG